MRTVFSLVVLAGLVACGTDGIDPNDVTPIGTSSGTAGASSGGTSADGGGSSSSGGGSSGAPSSSSGNPGQTIACSSEAALPGDPVAARTYCVSTEGGAEYKIVLPSGGSGAYRLGVFVHGDGATGYADDSAMAGLLGFADTHHMILVSVRAPNGCAWWLRPEYACPTSGAVDVATDRDATHANAAALDAVLRKVKTVYPVEGPLYFYGSSGGSVFLTYSFFPRFGNVYPGAFAIHCGGEAPLPETVTWNMDDPVARGTTKMWFTIGSEDDLLPYATGAVDYFEGKGFEVDEDVIAGAGHCEFDGNARALEVWTEFGF